MTNFTINDLRTGDLVICAKGKKATVMKNTGREDVLRFHTKENSFQRIDANYNNDLTSKKSSGFDIIRVYRAIGLPSNKIGDLVYNPDKMLEEGTVVYDRYMVTAADKLRTGDLLVHRNGKRSTVFKGTDFGDITRYHTDNNSFSYLSRYDVNFVHESNNGFDIVAIYRVSDADPTTFADAFCNPEIMETRANLIWREDTPWRVADENAAINKDAIAEALDAVAHAFADLRNAIEF